MISGRSQGLDIGLGFRVCLTSFLTFFTKEKTTLLLLLKTLDWPVISQSPGQHTEILASL